MQINFKVGENKYQIDEVRIKDYYELRTTLMLNSLEKKHDLISKMSGCPVEELQKLTPAKWNEIWYVLEVLIEKDLAEDQVLYNKVKLDGVEYGLVDLENLSIGEFADLDVIITDKKAENRLHEIMAILYRPIVSKTLFKVKIEDYSMETYKDRCNLFLDLPMRYTKSAMSFFLSFGLASMGLTETYLKLPKKKQRNLVKEYQKILLGRGTKHSFQSLAEIHCSSKGLVDSEYEKLLTSLFGDMMKTGKLNSNIKRIQENITA